MAVVVKNQRGTQDRGVPGAPAWATEPPVWGEPISWQHLREQLKELDRKKVYRYAYPDGSKYETTWHSESAAKAFASINGHRYLGEVRTEPRVERARPELDSRGTAPDLSPPPLVEAQTSPPKPPPPRKGTVPPPGPVPTPEPAPRPKPPKSFVPPPPEEYGIIDYIKEDFVHTTMTESMPLISKWFGRVGKVLKTVPGLQGVGKAYEAIAGIADGLQLVYELVHELNQAEALQKGSKQLVKRTKPVKRVAEALLKKKYPSLPESVRKKAAEILEDVFEKYGSDPAIERGRKKIQEMDEDKDLNKTLFDKLKKALTPTPALP